MKPGDLVKIRRMNLSLKTPIYYVVVYETIDSGRHGDEWKWEHGEVGVLLEGSDDIQSMKQVLHKGRAGWVEEEFLRVVDARD
jgi:hypothetical protein